MTDDLLRTARRCVLALPVERGPIVSPPLVMPMAFWSDGASLWMATSASSVKVQRLAGRTAEAASDDTEVADDVSADGPRETSCAVYIAPDDPGSEHVPISRGLSIDGTARVYTLDDPVGFAVHWPVVSAAMAALAVKNVASLTGYALDLPRTPLRWLPTNRVAIRVRMHHIRPVVPPPVTEGIAPALPGVVPSDIRRALAGQRRGVVAIGGTDPVRLQPVVVGAGLALDVGGGPSLTPGMRAVLALDADPGGRPSDVRGLALHGTITPGAALDAERATWWRGFDVSGARIPRQPAGGIVLPD